MKWRDPKPKHLKLTKWKWLVSYPENLIIGKRVDIGAFTYIQAKEGVILGDDVKVGSHVSIYSVSTIDGKKGTITVGNNAKVGSHSVIMPGVEIGENSVIGALSFIPSYTKIPKNEIWVGVPIKRIRKIPHNLA